MPNRCQHRLACSPLSTVRLAPDELVRSPLVSGAALAAFLALPLPRLSPYRVIRTSSKGQSRGATVADPTAGCGEGKFFGRGPPVWQR
jgi:hypothetical protein